jgi:hypothetical protein
MNEPKTAALRNFRMGMKTFRLNQIVGQRNPEPKQTVDQLAHEVIVRVCTGSFSVAITH